MRRFSIRVGTVSFQYTGNNEFEIDDVFYKKPPFVMDRKKAKRIIHFCNRFIKTCDSERSKKLLEQKEKRQYEILKKKFEMGIKL